MQLMTNYIIIPILLFVNIISCEVGSKSKYIEENLCDIICTLMDQNYVGEDTIHNKIVLFGPIMFIDKTQGLGDPVETTLNFDHGSCECANFIFVPSSEDIYNGQYNNVYRLNVSKFSGRNNFRLKYTGYNDLNKLGPSSHYISHLDFTMKKVDNKWILLWIDPYELLGPE